jgi:hypothetical protein
LCGDGLSNGDLSILLEACPFLQQLSFEDCPLLTQVGFLAALSTANNHTHLFSLGFAGNCNHLDGMFMWDILNRFPGIRQLDIPSHWMMGQIIGKMVDGSMFHCGGINYISNHHTLKREDGTGAVISVF